MVAHQEDTGFPAALVRGVTAGRRLRPAFHDLPLVAAGKALLNGRAPWYQEWASLPCCPASPLLTQDTELNLKYVRHLRRFRLT